jgi:hypothetical protein
MAWSSDARDIASRSPATNAISPFPESSGPSPPPGNRVPVPKFPISPLPGHLEAGWPKTGLILLPDADAPGSFVVEPLKIFFVCIAAPSHMASSTTKSCMGCLEYSTSGPGFAEGAARAPLNRRVVHSSKPVGWWEQVGGQKRFPSQLSQGVIHGIGEGDRCCETCDLRFECY